MSVSEVITLQTGTLRNQVLSRTDSLPTQVAPRIETVAPGVQHGQVVCRSEQSIRATGAQDSRRILS